MQNGDQNMQDTILPDKIKNRYRLIEQIGTGGMGNVYLAEDTELYRKVAIKAIKPELLDNEEVQKRIEYECRMHAAIRSHPHIVTLFDRVVDGANILLIMEYVEGTTLSKLIKTAQDNDEPLPLAMVITLLRQLLSALQAIHGYGIIHRDIKPSNILVERTQPDNPQAKLMDFGIAKNAEGYEQMTMLTQIDTGGPGTPAYMAPERIDTETFGEICPATDLYSVGIIFYELLCLKPPFQGTMTEIFAGQLARQPNLNQLESFPKEIQEIIRKALAKKPEERYPNAVNFSQALANFLNPGGASASSTFHEQTNKTMLATDISDARAKVCQQDHRQKSKFSPIAITGTIIGMVILLVIIFAVPHLRRKKAPESNTNQGYERINAAENHGPSIAAPRERDGEKRHRPIVVALPQQSTKEDSPATKIPPKTTTEDTLAVQEEKQDVKHKESTAALDALKQERQKKRERELIRQEEEKKKRVRQQFASRPHQTVSSSGRHVRVPEKRPKRQEKQPVYIVIPDQ